MGRIQGKPAPPPRNRRAGWYPDPGNRHRQRYWDGLEWRDEFRLRQADGDEGSSVEEVMVCTTDHLPGQTVIAVLGIVTELSASSGLTATDKGNVALDDALRRLRNTAGALGANAIIGLTGGPFGARGGVTSAFGGDAVGILLMGTAVIVERDDPSH